MSLEELIKERIREHGSITVADYMEIALFHPEHGYYMQRDPLGIAGDFITAPEISQVFGEIIGAWLAHSWQLLGSPSEAILVELGAGRGTLMADILRATRNIKGFHEAITVNLVEISPVLKQKQWKALAGKHPRLEWHESIATLPQLPLLLVANEFFDALPIRQFYPLPNPPHSVERGFSIPSPAGGGGLGRGIERMVGIVDDKLVFIPQESAKLVEICPAATEIMGKICEHITAHDGAALIIDYGYTEGSKGDTLQAMKNHSYHPPLQDAGNADITAHVDFLALSDAAKTEDVNVHGPIPQGQFLMRLGAGARTTALCENAGEQQQKALISGLKRLADPAEMGELFKVLALTSKQIEKAGGF